MLVIREIVNRDIFKNYKIPKEFGDRFEMILVPVDTIRKSEEVLSSNEDETGMKYQEENGFAKNILAQKSEDVWNDI
jgi:hypothetical protein